MKFMTKFVKRTLLIVAAGRSGHAVLYCCYIVCKYLL